MYVVCSKWRTTWSARRCWCRGSGRRAWRARPSWGWACTTTSARCSARATGTPRPPPTSSTLPSMSPSVSPAPIILRTSRSSYRTTRRISLLGLFSETVFSSSFILYTSLVDRLDRYNIHWPELNQMRQDTSVTVLKSRSEEEYLHQYCINFDYERAVTRLLRFTHGVNTNFVFTPWVYL